MCSPDRPPLSLWHIENSAGTFLLLDRPGPAPVDAAFDLRDMLRFVSLGQAAPRPDAPPLGGGAGLSRLPSRQGASGAASSLPSLEDGDEGGTRVTIYSYFPNGSDGLTYISGDDIVTQEEPSAKGRASLRGLWNTKA